MSLVLAWQFSYVEAQCTFLGPEIIAPNSTRFFNLEISGVVNDDLSSPTQGVCGVILDFQHPLIGDLSIRLISPNNDTITLVGPLGITNFTNNTRWNISFLPCGFPSDPDPGFTGEWSNLQPWGQFGYYEGSYHPASGCLEDFNTGSVNGIWQLEFINNYPFDVPINSAILHSFTLLFCDPDGFDCQICFAKGGNLISPEGSFCAGVDSLLIDPEIQIVGILPSEDEYDYIFLIGQNGRLVDTTAMPDLRHFPPGNYQICGLSYIIRDEDLLPAPDGSVSIAQLRSQLRSNNPPFCGSVSSRCLDISILPRPDTTFETAHLCMGDTLIIGRDTITEAGIYSQMLTSADGCDSIVHWQVSGGQIHLVYQSDRVLDCGGFVELGFEDLQFAFPPDSFELTWYDEIGQVLSRDERIISNRIGRYFLEIIAYWGENVCSATFDFFILPNFDFPEFTIQYLPLACAGSRLPIRISPMDFSTMELYLNTGEGLLSLSPDSSFFYLQVNNASDVELCIRYLDSCSAQLYDTCFVVSFVDGGDSEILIDPYSCSQRFSVELIGFSSLPEIILMNGPGSISPITIQLDLLEYSTSEPGRYYLNLLDYRVVCDLVYSFDVEVLPIPYPNVVQHESFLCFPDTLEMRFVFPGDHNYSVTLDIGGQRRDFLIQGGLGGGHIRLAFDEVSPPLRVVGYSIVDYPLCTEADNLDLDIEVSSKPNIEFGNFPDTACNSVSELWETVFDISALIGSGWDSIEWIDLQNSGAIQGRFFNFTDLEPGRYGFIYRLEFDDRCPLLEDTIFIEVLSCHCPPLLQDQVFHACEGEYIDLSTFQISADGSWSWLSGPIGSVVEIENNMVSFDGKLPGRYTFQLYKRDSIGQCPETDTLEIILHKLYELGSLLTDSIFVCHQLDTIIYLDDYVQSVDGGIWSYSGSDPAVQIGFDPMQNSISIGGLSTGVYVFEYGPPPDALCVTDEQVLCLHLSVEPKRFENLVADFDIGCNQPNAEFIIRLDTAKFKVRWFVLSGDFVLENENSFYLLINKPGDFKLELTELRNGCVTEEWFTIRQIDELIDSIEIQAISPSCPEGSDGSISVTKIYGGNSPYDFSIGSAFQRDSLFENLSAGIYSLTVVDRLGCRFESRVMLLDPQRYHVEIAGRQNVLPGFSETYRFNSDVPEDSISQVFWYLNDELFCSGCREVVLELFSSSTLRIIMVDGNGCIYQDQLLITVTRQNLIFVPEIFTPNRDGINDEFVVFTPDPRIYVHEFSVFDRWGSRVYSAHDFFLIDMKTGWDGTFRGILCQPGSFVYMLIFSRSDEENQVLRGEVFLAR